MQWLAGEDSFTFNEQPIENELSPMKRNFLKKSMWPINRIQIQESAIEERENDSRKRERSKVGRAESIGIKVSPERTMTTMEAITVQS